MNNYRCCSDFQSQYGYLNDIPNHINSYNEINKNKYKCYHGHDLVYVQKSKYNNRKAHFRHKNTDDTIDRNISEWHSSWQGEFEIIEYTLRKKDKQLTNRRADVFIKAYNLVVEFQNSKITEGEVNNRKHDYDLHDIKIIWLINGNIHCEREEFDNGRKFLTFHSNWICDSYHKNYNIIYLDIDNLIYKINPNEIKSKMLDVQEPYSHEDFIQMINNNNNNLYTIIPQNQCKLYISQLGAGNGKTYGIIQNLQSKEFEHYDTILFVTKQHSAKEVIYKEFKDQIENNQLEYIKEYKFLNEKTYKIDKKYILEFTNIKIGISQNIIICTIDSLMYKLNNKSTYGCDKFQKIIENIIDENINNSLSYKNLSKIILNKKICVIIDETQDLPKSYGNAIIKLMKNKYVDCYIVGDKMQSIFFEDNAFIFLKDKNEFPNIEKIKFEEKNICRRFTNKKLVDFCNNMINFGELPKITPYEFSPETDTCLKLIEGRNIHKDKSELEQEIEKIMEYYQNEVKNNKRKPNDFLIVTPFTKNNTLIDALEVAINKFWNKEYNDEKYIRYAYFHKSEEGTSIDTTQSIDATRIVSIHCAKGDGRNVVFVVGCSEFALKKFSNNKINLIYESLLHVSITRMKQTLYFVYIPNCDNIHQRISKYGINNNDNEIIPYLPNSNSIKYNYIIESDTNDDILNILNEHIMKKCDYDDYNENDKKEVIDMQHHNIRCFCMYISFMLVTMFKNQQVSNQIKAILIKIKNSNFTKNSYTSWKDYYKMLSNNRDMNIVKSKEKREIRILSYNNNRESQYKIYENIINDNIEILRNKIKKIIKLENMILCPYEMIILYYMWNVCEYGSKINDLTITELYEITHIYYNSYTHNLRGHEYCNCNRYFKNNNENNELYQYLLLHYEKIDIYNKEIDKFLNENKNLNILWDYFFVKENKHITHDINTRLTIGYNDDDVYIIYIHPTFNELNHNHYLIKSIYDTYFIINNNKNDDRINNNKNFKCVLFSCDSPRHYIFYWNKDIINDNDIFFKYRIKEYMLNIYLSMIKNYYIIIREKYLKSNENTIKDKLVNIMKEYEKNEEGNIIYNYIDKKIMNRLTDKIYKNNIQELINETILNEDDFIEEFRNFIEELICNFLYYKDSYDEEYNNKYINKLDEDNF